MVREDPFSVAPQLVFATVAPKSDTMLHFGDENEVPLGMLSANTCGAIAAPGDTVSVAPIVTPAATCAVVSVKFGSSRL